MKGLIHSKKFRQNLYKWLFVYIGVLGLLATVVTYSKYISSLGTKDEARVTKFNVKIRFQEDCAADSTETICKTGNHLPFEDMVYYFTVDTSELEVTANLYLTAKFKDTVSSNYEISEIAESKLVDGKIVYESVTDQKNSSSIALTSNAIEINSTNRGEKLYRVTVKYTGDNDVDEKDASYSLYVGYSARQKTDGNNLATPALKDNN